MDAIKKNGFVYEPSFEDIIRMLQVLRDQKPVKNEAVQFTGGEPLLREDMLDIIREAAKMGFKHIQLNTNGIMFALDPELPKKYRQAGVNVVYMSFDGTTGKTNPKNHEYIPKIIENCRKAGLSLTLVPTLINTVNDHEIWNIVKFAIGNIDIVRSVNFQPVSFVGTMAGSSKEDARRKEQRITIPDLIKKLEEQSRGAVPAKAFYPASSVVPVSKLVSKTLGKDVVEFTCNSHCGSATYLFKEGEKIIPVSDFIDVDAFFELLNELASEKLSTPVGKAKGIAKLYLKLGKIVNKEKAPKNFDVTKTIVGALTTQGQGALDTFHHNSLMIGAMHFMDPYNYDVDRVQRCVIHYVVPDGRIIPFCAFNALPEIYREAINKKFGIPIAEWEKRTGKKLEDDLKRV